MTVSPAPLFGGVFAGRRVLLTGHTGFKGSWLAQWLLGLGAEVSGFALEPPTEPSLFEELGLASRITHHIGDIRDPDDLSGFVARQRPEVVLHLAAQPLVRLSYEQPVATYGTNVMGTVHLLEAVRACEDTRAVVCVTSDKCYENREDGRAYREDEAMGGWDPYSSSKGCAELVTAAYRRSFFGAPTSPVIVSARAGNVVGGGDWAPDRILPDCIRALEGGVPIHVRNPASVRPWQHVLEPLAGYLLLASRMLSGSPHAVDGAWNFGPGPDSTVPVREVAEVVIREWGSGSWTTDARAVPAVHEATLLALDISKAERELGWRPLYDIDRTLRTTTAWYRARSQGADVRNLTDADIDAYIAAARAAGAPWAADTGVAE